MLQLLLPALYVSYGACEQRGEQGPGIQSSYVCLDDLLGYCLEMIVQSAGLPSHPPSASRSQILPSVIASMRSGMRRPIKTDVQGGRLQKWCK